MEENRVCNVCHEEKLESEFYRSKDKPKRICKLCECLQVTARKSKMRKRRQQHINRWKIHHGCSECGVKDNATNLHIHHVNGNDDKHDKVSSMLNSNSIKRIIEEIRKCVILCSSCHQEAHRIMKQQET